MSKDEKIAELTMHYDKNYPVFIKIALDMLRNREDARDAVQDAFVRAVQYVDKYKKDNMRAWLCKIVVNTCSNFRRRPKNNIKKVDIQEYYVQEDLAVFGRLRPAVDDVLSILENGCCDVGNDKMCDAINGLNEKRFTILLLVALDYEYDEIANILNIPKNTVGTSLRRARRVLDRKLNGRQD